MLSFFLRLCGTGFFLLFSAGLFAQTGRVGINTVVPLAMLHVSDSAVLFTGPVGGPPGFTSFGPPVSGPGTRMFWYPQKAAFRVGNVFSTNWDKDSIGVNSFAAGQNTKALGGASVSMGGSTTASGSFSTSMGGSTTASGHFSTSMGQLTSASGNCSTSMGQLTSASAFSSTSMGGATSASGLYSTSMGQSTSASGFSSTSMGGSTSASGSYSTSLGFGTISQAFASVSFGQYNDSIVSSNPSAWASADPLLIIGNGISSVSPHNAMTLLKNGNLGLNNNSPDAPLHIISNSSSGGPFHSLSSMILEDNTSNFIQFSNPNAVQTGILSGNSQTAIRGAIIFGADSSVSIRTGGNNTRVYFDNNGNVGIGNTTPGQKLQVNGNICYTGSIAACSDIRYKKNLQSLNNPLSSLMQLNGYYYNWKTEEFPAMDFSDRRQLGFIAQEMEKLYPELVQTDGKGYKSVDYGRLTPVLVEAMKEQERKIESLQEEVNDLKKIIHQQK